MFATFRRLIVLAGWLTVSVVSGVSGAYGQNPAAPELNLTLGEQRVKFAPTRGFQEMRLEVVNHAGETVFTHLTTDAEFDWNLRAGNGEPLAAGLYSYVLTLKLGEEQTRQHRGNLIIEEGQQQVWLTAQDGAEVSGTALNAARGGGRSVAGFHTSDDKAVKRDVSGREIVDEKGNKLTDSTKAVKQEKAALLGTQNKVAKFDVGGVNLIDSAMTDTGHVVIDSSTNTQPAGFGSLIIQGQANKERVELRSAGATPGPALQGKGFGGTIAAPTATLLNTDLFIIGGSGHNGTGLVTVNAATVKIKAEQNWTGTGNGAFINFETTPSGSPTSARVERMRITGDGRVGIGTTAPEAELEIDNENDGSASPHLFVTGHSVEPQIIGRQSTGTHAAPTATLANNTLLFMGGRGHTGTAFVTSSKGAVQINANENWSTTANGTHITLDTTSNGTTAKLERMRMDHDGQVGIGTTAPTALLSVNGTANKTGGGSWTVFSDERLKDIKGRYTTGWQALRKLQPIRFEYKADNALGLKNLGETIGFSAQAVAEAIPEAVSLTPQGYLQLNQDPILWTMLNAVKEQQSLIETLLQQNSLLKQQHLSQQRSLRAVQKRLQKVERAPVR